MTDSYLPVAWVRSEFRVTEPAADLTPEMQAQLEQAWDRALRGLYLRTELAMYGPNLPTAAQAYEMLVRYGFIEQENTP